MKRMYKISKAISYVFAGLAVTAGMMLLCVDVDRTPEEYLIKFYPVTVLAISVFAFLGWLFFDITKICKVILPASVVAFAWTHELFECSLPIKSFQKAYKIKSQCGTYCRTYKVCQKIYMDWIIKEFFYAEEKI